MVVPASHPPGPAGAPGPHHGRHIMNERQPLAGLSQPMSDAPAEPRAVDRHDGVGPQFADLPRGLAHPPQDQRCPRQHFGHSGNRQIRQRNKACQPLLRHAFATDPGDPQPAAGTLTQCRDQRSAEGVPRRLAGDYEDERCGVTASCHGPLVMTRRCRLRTAPPDRRRERPRRDQRRSSYRPPPRFPASPRRPRVSPSEAQSSADRRDAPGPASPP